MYTTTKNNRNSTKRKQTWESNP